ncbi:MAG: cytochrome c3 family protein [bacterium]
MMKILLFLVALFLGLPVAAQNNEKCFMCHSPLLKKISPAGKEISLFVDKGSFAKSTHSKLTCTKCHKDIKLDPMMHKPPKYNPANACISCHKMNESKHGTSGISCIKCHFSGVQSHKFGKDGSNKFCLSCHKMVADAGVHGSLTCLHCHKEIHKDLKSQSCTACHQTMKSYSHKTVDCFACHSDETVCRENDQIVATKTSHNIVSRVDCAKCHFKENQLGLPKADPDTEYKGSIHCAEGNKDTPDCKYCHGKLHEPSKTIDTLKLCSTCHSDEKKMAKYGLSTYPVTSYKESFHGIAQKYGQKGMPVCTDCHNTHDIRSKNDPKSSINKANVPGICAKCHKTAHPNFAVNLVHLKPQPKGSLDSMLVFWINTFYIYLLIPGVIGGMMIHVSLNLFRSLRSKKEKK